MTSASTPAVRIAAAQMHCVPGDVEQNLGRIHLLVRAAAADGAQLVVLPETATTGYFIADQLVELAQSEDGAAARRLADMASEFGVHLAVGMAISEAGKYYDAQLLFGPDGTRLATYRKVHLFSAEREWYSAGETPMVVDTEIGRIGMSICYDLMFPEFIRKLVDQGAELVINSTNWISNEFQRDTWGWTGSAVEALARTRALENGVWLAMANCIGPEAEFNSLGHSCVVAPSGKLLASAGDGHGFAAGDIRQSAELEQWRAIATYRDDRRHDVYR